MTTSEAKKEVRRRLDAAKVPYRSVTAKTVSFGDLARSGAIFVSIDSDVPNIPALLFHDIPKPSKGGFIVTYA
jgi:hypothetical protein